MLQLFPHPCTKKDLWNVNKFYSILIIILSIYLLGNLHLSQIVGIRLSQKEIHPIP